VGFIPGELRRRSAHGAVLRRRNEPFGIHGLTVVEFAVDAAHNLAAERVIPDALLKCTKDLLSEQWRGRHVRTLWVDMVERAESVGILRADHASWSSPVGAFLLDAPP
jgi:hypothetical protein